MPHARAFEGLVTGSRQCNCHELCSRLGFGELRASFRVRLHVFSLRTSLACSGAVPWERTGERWHVGVMHFLGSARAPVWEWCTFYELGLTRECSRVAPVWEWCTLESARAVPCGSGALSLNWGSLGSAPVWLPCGSGALWKVRGRSRVGVVHFL